ncbi:serine hydroxymethyltransferase [uncultured Methanobrevibacter sp.]|uniref:serine hydroxymethyltransferase n=1 Tax=uncultured Methanobrevibacter sp. TaxID=253161 RepID=UPI0015BE90D3|nr:serine hydroxymethyltransferase [uncultured Methanobrevibacter sp.]
MSDNLNELHEFEGIIEDHTNYMRNSINLIASENIVSIEVKEAIVSDFEHRYAEGQAYERLYEGCQYIDQIEDLTKASSRKIFNAAYANVQPVSGVTANLASFFAFGNRGDKLMALEVPTGGHISHAKVSAAGICGLKTINQPFDPEIMNIDIDAMNKKILEEKPKIILFGASLFLFPHPVAEAREAADEVGATIMYDGAHVLGLIGGGQFQQPLEEGADLMMGSTHKTYPGPQGGIILARDAKYEDKINNAVFPGVVSNHHLHHLAGLGIANTEMMEFGEDYAKQVIKNAQTLGGCLYELGFDVLCEDQGFTKSHQLALRVSDIRPATDIAHDLAANNVILNKNLLPGDNVDDSDNPSGLRIGTQEITRRGLKEKEMMEVAEFIKAVAVDKKDIKEDVTEFMNQYTTVHYAFSERDGYKVHKL